MAEGPDYSRYSVAQLRDAYEHVDKSRYPERAKQIERELSTRNAAEDAPIGAGSVADAVGEYREVLEKVFLVVHGFVAVAAILLIVNYASAWDSARMIVPYVLLVSSAVAAALWAFRAPLAVYPSLVVQVLTAFSISVGELSYEATAAAHLIFAVGTKDGLSVEAGLEGLSYQVASDPMGVGWVFGLNLLAVGAIVLLIGLHQYYQSK